MYFTRDRIFGTATTLNLKAFLKVLESGKGLTTRMFCVQQKSGIHRILRIHKNSTGYQRVQRNSEQYQIIPKNSKHVLNNLKQLEKNSDEFKRIPNN